MNFHDRNIKASAWEAELTEKLNHTGYPAWGFGQALLPERFRQCLRNYKDGWGRPTYLRWMPDIIVDCDGKPALIDAKTTMDEYPDTYSLEIDAVETCLKYFNEMNTPIYFVFQDWRVLTPMKVRSCGKRKKPRPDSKGSGTEFVVVQRRLARPFDDVFPARAL